ncbi:MAG: 50S ribosomal protein L23 [Actinomycetota bacterium]
MSAARDVILKPVVSEKSYALIDANSYTFLVAPDATKTQIRQAVEEIWPEVKVGSVNTITRKGKRKRYRHVMGQRPNAKRAIVKLAEGKIELFETR